MFALHETTQRRVCRLTFLVLCVVPTLLTLIGVAYFNRPWRQADWQRTLVQQLHVRARLDDVSRPRPEVTVLTNLRLSDLLSDHLLGSIGRLDLRHQDSRVVFHADHLEIQSKQLPTFAKAISTWLATGHLVPLDFHADRLTIAGESPRVIQLKDLSIRSHSTSAKRQRFRLMARTSAHEIVELALDAEQGVLRCALDTQQTSLPAWLVGKLVPGVGGCGEAKFSGVVSAESANQNIRGKLIGNFEEVDLQTWVGSACPHRLQGTARVELEQLTWTENRLEIARGKIMADGGTISDSLLLNAKDLCACVTGPHWENMNPANPQELVSFDELALSFQMTRAGILFAGECENGGVISVEGAPLLFAPSKVPKETLLPVGQLVQLLDYRRQPGWLPATRSAVSMAGKLPLPGNEARASANIRK